MQILKVGALARPARLLAGLITERGLCPATAAGLLALFPERNPGAALT